MTNCTQLAKKFLVLDGIGGVPLGREITKSLQENGHTAAYVDCLEQTPRPLYELRSACIKAINKQRDGDGFFLLPKLTPQILRTIVEAEAPTHILVIGFIYKFFAPSELRQIADDHKTTLLLYDTDSCNLFGKRREFIFFIEQELPVYDRVYSFSKVTTQFFRDTRKLDAFHLPFGAKPIPTANTPKTLEVLFVGSCDLRRIFLLETIRQHITVRGNRWQRNAPLISAPLYKRIDDRQVWGDELHTLLGSAKIVLNITRTDFFGAETGVNLRIFEALAAGCFLLTDHCEEIREIFAIGTELETYRSSEELADKVRYYLEHDDERERIARAGSLALQQEHTWKKRISYLLNHLRQQSSPSNQNLLPEVFQHFDKNT